METTMLQPHQQRVITEKAELDSKIINLKTFLKSETFKEISFNEQQRLIKQQVLMDLYSEVLGERIAAFN
jgi:hypothetical protein